MPSHHHQWLVFFSNFINCQTENECPWNDTRAFFIWFKTFEPCAGFNVTLELFFLVRPQFPLNIVQIGQLQASVHGELVKEQEMKCSSLGGSVCSCRYFALHMKERSCSLWFKGGACMKPPPSLADAQDEPICPQQTFSGVTHLTSYLIPPP